MTDKFKPAPYEEEEIDLPQGWPIKKPQRYPRGWPPNLRAVLYLNSKKKPEEDDTDPPDFCPMNLLGFYILEPMTDMNCYG
jgi:hypothetical protein